MVDWFHSFRITAKIRSPTRNNRSFARNARGPKLEHFLTFPGTIIIFSSHRGCSDHILDSCRISQFGDSLRTLRYMVFQILSVIPLESGIISIRFRKHWSILIDTPDQIFVNVCYQESLGDARKALLENHDDRILSFDRSCLTTGLVPAGVEKMF